jgi:hypothetical protein
VASRPAGLRGNNPEVTAEQVCRGLNRACAHWLDQVRATSRLQYTAEVIDYLRRRNRAASEPRQQQFGFPSAYMRAAGQPAAPRRRQR